MSLQNGVDSEDIIENAIGPGHVIGAVAYVSAKIDSPGVISEAFNQQDHPWLTEPRANATH